MVKAVSHFSSVYHIPAFCMKGRLCKTNISSNTAYRGFGVPQVQLVMENIMTDIAIKCGISQVQVTYLLYLLPIMPPGM